MGPIWGGSKKQQMLLVKFEGFPRKIVHEVWVGVIFHDPC